MSSTLVAHLLLSEFIWSITWGIHHQLINTITMALLLRLFSRMPTVQAVFTSCAIQVASFALFCICAAFAIFFVGTHIPPEHYCCVPTAMNAALYLGIINALFNSIFALVFLKKPPIRKSWIVTIVILSNALTVLVLAFVFPPHL